jgi:hypothetical protein
MGWHLKKGAAGEVGEETWHTIRAVRRAVRSNTDVENTALVKG